MWLFGTAAEQGGRWPRRPQPDFGDDRGRCRCRGRRCCAVGLAEGGGAAGQGVFGRRQPQRARSPSTTPVQWRAEALVVGLALGSEGLAEASWAATSCGCGQCGGRLVELHSIDTPAKHCHELCNARHHDAFGLCDTWVVRGWWRWGYRQCCQWPPQHSAEVSPVPGWQPGSACARWPLPAAKAWDIHVSLERADDSGGGGSAAKHSSRLQPVDARHHSAAPFCARGLTCGLELKQLWPFERERIC
mmetsp:Transcript_81844/g.265100  ORF Transcript_81844/g.265100 Transcript_81844/m.265100 type:complete len:246 (+) Transcript_81844:225-962(+)